MLPRATLVGQWQKPTIHNQISLDLEAVANRTRGVSGRVTAPRRFGQHTICSVARRLARVAIFLVKQKPGAAGNPRTFLLDLRRVAFAARPFFGGVV